MRTREARASETSWIHFLDLVATRSRSSKETRVTKILTEQARTAVKTRGRPITTGGRNATHKTVAAALFWISSFVFGCEHGDTSHPALTPASGTTPSAERAAEDVTRARCDRAERCGEVDQGALFSNRQHCLETLWQDSVDQLSPCRSGVDRAAVEQCLSEIGQHGCDDAMGGFDQYLACKVEDLCI